MKKFTLILAFLAVAAGVAYGQENNEVNSATQSTSLVMSNAIDITFNATGNAVGGPVSLVFNNVNDYANGVESDAYQIKVRSNKKFRVQARTSSSRFTYTGTTTPAPQMNVSNTLFLKISDNTTGGTVSSNFNNNFRSLTNSNQTLVNNATPGGNKSFNVKYKANPGYNFPAGNYTVNVLYTATQL